MEIAQEAYLIRIELLLGAAGAETSSA